jgi:hypothetical protein
LLWPQSLKNNALFLNAFYFNAYAERIDELMYFADSIFFKKAHIVSLVSIPVLFLLFYF